MQLTVREQIDRLLPYSSVKYLNEQWDEANLGDEVVRRATIKLGINFKFKLTRKYIKDLCEEVRRDLGLMYKAKELPSAGGSIARIFLFN